MKFGVPGSGWWRQGGEGGEGGGEGGEVFEIPLIPLRTCTTTTTTSTLPSTSTPTSSTTSSSVPGTPPPPHVPPPPPTPHVPPFTSPSLIIFELTPLSGVRDELARRYVVLGDCTRLRGVVEGVGRGGRGRGREGSKAMSKREGDGEEGEGWKSKEEGDGEGDERDEREFGEDEGNEEDEGKDAEKWFIPSLILIHWAEKEDEEIPRDVVDLISLYTPSSSPSPSSPTSTPHIHHPSEQPTLAAYSVLSITSTATDLDARFERALGGLSGLGSRSESGLGSRSGLDVDGRLVRVVEGVNGLFTLLQPAFTAFLGEWLDNCSSGSGSGSGFASTPTPTTASSAFASSSSSGSVSGYTSTAYNTHTPNTNTHTRSTRSTTAYNVYNTYNNNTSNRSTRSTNAPPTNSTNSSFNWPLYTHLLRALVELINHALDLVCALVRRSQFQFAVPMRAGGVVFPEFPVLGTREDGSGSGSG
ncbi:hypothetical protein F5879DRAFT_1005617, partial [Lentinula edodes]